MCIRDRRYAGSDDEEQLLAAEQAERHARVEHEPQLHHMGAVSYTHLDVYKRQLQLCRLGHDGSQLFRRGHVGLGFPLDLFAPVSYTHLDVYKRQVLVMWPGNH